MYKSNHCARFQVVEDHGIGIVRFKWPGLVKGTAYSSAYQPQNINSRLLDARCLPVDAAGHPWFMEGSAPLGNIVTQMPDRISPPGNKSQ